MTYRQTDGQTDRLNDRHNMSPDPEGGDITRPLEISKAPQRKDNNSCLLNATDELPNTNECHFFQH